MLDTKLTEHMWVALSPPTMHQGGRRQKRLRLLNTEYCILEFWIKFNHTVGANMAEGRTTCPAQVSAL